MRQSDRKIIRELCAVLHVSEGDLIKTLSRFKKESNEMEESLNLKSKTN